MIKNNLKKKFKKRSKIFAYWITNFDLISLEIVLKSNVYDCYVIDMEHSSINFKNLEDIIRVIDAYNKPTLVRIEKIDNKEISKSLDLGAIGIIAPNVNSEKDLNYLIDSTLYPPNGNRGVGLSRSCNHGESFKDYYRNFNKSAIIIPMIENKNALKEIKNIIKNKNIDCILIGPYDMSASLGKPGNFKTFTFKNIIKNILNLCLKNKVSCGMHIVHTNEINLRKINKQGYNFLPFSTDIQIFIDGLFDKIKIIKKNK